MQNPIRRLDYELVQFIIFAWEIVSANREFAYNDNRPFRIPPPDWSMHPSSTEAQSLVTVHQSLLFIREGYPSQSHRSVHDLLPS